MSDHTTREEYRGILKSMAKDAKRSDRKREVERAFGGRNIRSILRDLHDRCDGNRSEMVRQVNERLESDESLSRQTLYNWLDEHSIE